MNLREVPLAEVRALVSGAPTLRSPLAWHPEYPQPETVDGWALALAAHEVAGLSACPIWWVHQIVDGEQVVGDVGFHGPPASSGDRVVEIGYQVVPARRGRGLATRACRLILERAWSDGADRVVASTASDNVASQQVLLRNGFRRLADGEFALDRP